jgi:hypothetical protein
MQKGKIMKKKLMLPVAAVVAVLALAALPAFASGGEYVADCQSGAECSATLAFGVGALSDTSGETISCTSATGVATQISGTSTGTVQVLLHGCRETVTIFKFSCNSAGKPAGTITMNTMTTHLANLEPGSTVPGVLYTGVNMTYNCPGFATKTLTGELHRPDREPELQHLPSQSFHHL